MPNSIKRFFSAKPVTPEASRYIEGTARSVPAKSPVDQLRFVVLDAETTGFRIGEDKLLSLAGLPVLGGRAQIADMGSWLVYQEDAHVTAATKIHGILPSESTCGDPENEVIANFMEMMTGAILVGHHVGFDAAVLDFSMRKHFNTKIRNTTLDTAVLSMQVVDAFRRTGYANQRPPGLDEVCSQLGLPSVERHTAEGDTFTTAQLFLILCARMRQKLQRPLLASDLPILKGG